jgi:hypothetical protein
VVVKKIKERHGKGKEFQHHVVARARNREADVVVQRVVKESTEAVRLGGIGFVLGNQSRR